MTQSNEEKLITAGDHGKGYPKLQAKLRDQTIDNGPDLCGCWGGGIFCGIPRVSLPKGEFPRSPHGGMRLIPIDRALMAIRLGRELDPRTEVVEHSCGSTFCTNEAHMTVVPPDAKQLATMAVLDSDEFQELLRNGPMGPERKDAILLVYLLGDYTYKQLAAELDLDRLDILESLKSGEFRNMSPSA